MLMRILLATALAAGPVPAADAAHAYIDALLSHDASAVPLAADAHRVENGLPTGSSGADIRWQLENGPQYRVIDAIRDVTVTTDGDQADAHYLLDAGVLGVDLATTEITEHFDVRGGEIHYIEATITPVF
ncbi:hypothetical protein [Amycolatopsis acidicola]|uniref:hypothetical protein n=1 Tax=Amycolatopsis acidicola TaxID=2596893 RepID=UPI001FB76C1F|nr:hypothetical protein [Amycolatopsis acidicola]